MTSITTIPATRVAPWCGVGKSGSWESVSEALYEGELDFTVNSSAAYDRYGFEVPGVRVNHNISTGEIIGVTSDQYGVVQNVDAFSLLDPFCMAGGVIEHAGMTEQGMCFMVMRMPSLAFGFKGDDFDLFVCAMNSFNTKFPCALIITPIRVFCQNLFRKLMRRGDTALLVKHGRFAKDRILSAGKASSLLLDYVGDFKDTLNVDLSNKRSANDVDEFVGHMLPHVKEGPERPRAKQSNARIDELRDEFVQEYYLAPDNERYWGTRLGILNAYYDWVTHHVPDRASSSFEDGRLGSLVSGTGVSSKLIAMA